MKLVLNKLFEILLNEYGPRKWWPANTPFEMMVGAILTQNTNWSNVEKAIRNFGDRLSPDFVLEYSHDELIEIIRPSGFFNQKAPRLKVLASWFKKYSFRVENTKEVDGSVLRAELLSLNGVGPETADSILLYALEKDFFVVDAYTRRIFSRLGFNAPKDYDSFRIFIESNIKRDLYIYNEFHALIVEHAKRFCKKQPSCDGCPLTMYCSYKLA